MFLSCCGPTLFPEVFNTLFRSGKEKPSTETLVLQKVEFEPVVFELCGESKKVTHKHKRPWTWAGNVGQRGLCCYLREKE